jgi:hypothetical protein
VTAASIPLPTPRQPAIETQFAPFLRLALTTLALAVGRMFGVATARTAAAFAEPHSFAGLDEMEPFALQFSC